MLSPIPDTYDAYKLLHDGSLALADVEQYGMKVDVDYIKKAKRKLRIQIKRQERKLKKRTEVKEWKKVFRTKFNLDSNAQLSHILYDVLGLGSETDNKSVSADALEQINAPIVNDIIHYRRLKKIKDTYLENYLREQVDGIIHPFFHLHTVATFRSSSSKINFQNQPVRIPFVKWFVRNAVIPRKGFMIGEIDYSGVEVSIAACYHKDKNMIADILDPKRDMHRDMAAQCFTLNKNQVTSQIRYCGKNMFVFPQFYGDYYGNNANALWNAINTLKLVTVDGTPLKQHLRKKNLTTLTKFTNHIKEVERYFWEERYPQYAEWKDEHWEKYLERGYVDLKTGFRCQGLMSRNDAINYPIQGSAFHCLLWSLIQINKLIKKHNLKSRIIGQIHDSIVFEIWPSELNFLMEQVNKIATRDIRNHWPWIILPLEIEVEMSPKDKSWYFKEEVKKQYFDCDCGSHWFYVKKTDTGDIEYECPVCGDIYE